MKAVGFILQFRRAIVAGAVVLAVGACAACADPLFRAPFVGIPAGGPSDFVRAIDLNNDGKVDLVTTERYNGTVHVILGLGGGAFGSPSAYGVSLGGSKPLIADLNGDGKLDIGIADFPNTSIGYLPGNGDGTFGDTVHVDTGFQCYTLGAGDFNGDGRMDLAVANWASVGILLGQGGGRFGVMTSYPTYTNVYRLAVGDLNMDGHPDIVTAGDNPVISVLFAKADTSFESYQALLLASGVTDLVITDATGDGKPDVVASTTTGISIFPGHGDGTFGPRMDLAAPASVAVAVADLNQDSHPDLISVPAGGGSALTLFFGDGLGGFPGQATIETMVGPQGVDVLDANKDGHPDLVVASSLSDVALHLGMGDGTFGSSPRYSMGANPIDVALGDLDGDSHDDMVVANHGSASISVCRGNGDGTFGIRRDFDTPGMTPVALAVGDLNGDGHADVAMVSTSPAPGIMVFRGFAGGVFAALDRYSFGSDPAGIAIGDLNGDGAQDLVVTDDVANRASVLLNAGNGTFLPPSHFGAGVGATGVAIADLDGDSHPDVVTANRGTGSITMLFGSGDGSFTSEIELPTAPDCRAVAVGFVNGDAIPDLVTANGSSGTISVLMGQGGRTFAPPTMIPTGGVPSSIELARLDGNLTTDVVFGNQFSPLYYYPPPPPVPNAVGVLLGSGSGVFTGPTLYGAGESPQSVAVADLDGSGGIDLVAASYTKDLITVLLHGGAQLAVPSVAAPVAFALRPAYPDPSPASVSIEFSVPRETRATLRIFDAGGRLVRTLMSGRTPEGAHRLTWNRQTDRGQVAPAGIYFCDLRAGDQRATRKIILL